uniref:Uncharacterized protein n=1 Tax=Zosterops lateralis melanops TaxID=1220523 RepID=A0A8D2NX15_ZOSLA
MCQHKLKFKRTETLWNLNHKAVCCGSCAFTTPFFPVFPVWPEFCAQTLSWPAGHCPGPQSQWNPAPAAAWSASPPAACRIYPSSSPQIHPPRPPAVQPPP